MNITTDPFSPISGKDIVITVTVKKQGIGDAGTFSMNFYKNGYVNNVCYKDPFGRRVVLR